MSQINEIIEELSIITAETLYEIGYWITPPILATLAVSMLLATILFLAGIAQLIIDTIIDLFTKEEKD